MRPNPLNRLRLAPEQMSLYCGAHVFVANRYGLIESGMDGLYYEQTRFLSRWTLACEGVPLKPVSANAVSSPGGTAYYLAPSPAGAAAGPPGENPDDRGGEIVEKGIAIQVNSFAGGGAHQDITVVNRTLRPVTIALDLSLEADFADLDEVVSRERKQSAPVRRTFAAGVPGAGRLTFAYTHPRLDHATTIDVAGADALFDEGSVLRMLLHLAPQQPRLLCIDIAPVFLGTPLPPWHGVDGVVTRHHPDGDHEARWRADCAILETATDAVQVAWDRAVADLASMHMLDGTGEARFTPMAGIPKYTALFGRDTLAAGLQSILLTPVTIAGSLSRVGEWTARGTDDSRDAQPGKVLHQHQRSPLALLGVTPFEAYYGDYSAPALFILGAAAHFAHTGDREAFASVRDNVFATLDWMDRDGDIDGDGLYEYRTLAGAKGIKNQGWKDSGQAILHADGAYVDDPIAVAEVQGLYYAAKQALAGVLTCLGEHARADDLMRQAAALKARFNAAFWLPDLRYFAIGIGPDKAPIRTVASDPGSCLAFGIIDTDKAAAVRDRLMSPDMFSGWGIRTLSAEHPAFNPLAYHLGSVWPVSNGNICFGLKRYGFLAACHILAEAMFDATGLFDYDRLPEVFGGHPRDKRHPHPGIYPDACSPQAWSATAVVQVMHALSGLTPLAPLDALIVDPALPAWCPDLTLRGIRIGSRRVSVALHREADGTTRHTVLEGGEGLRIIRPEPLPEGVDRFARVFAALA